MMAENTRTPVFRLSVTLSQHVIDLFDTDFVTASNALAKLNHTFDFT